MKPPAPVTRILLRCAIGKSSCVELTSFTKRVTLKNATGRGDGGLSQTGLPRICTIWDAESCPCAGHSPMTAAQGCGAPTPLLKSFSLLAYVLCIRRPPLPCQLLPHPRSSHCAVGLPLRQ